MQSNHAVRARGISKTFGDVMALDGVDLDVAEGQIHGLGGPNGAGKTTLLGLLLGLTAADGGSLKILGARVGRGIEVPAGVAGFIDGPGLYPALTARQNLTAIASFHRASRGRRTDVDELLDRVGLRDVARDPVRGFSLGMRQRLGLAAALVGHPRLLVLDEPANGLDPAGKRQVHRVLTELADSGVTIVLSSHRMDDVTEVCDEVTLLSAGRAVFSGPLSKLAAESGELDYRLVTSDPSATRAIAGDVRSLRQLIDPRSTKRSDVEALVLRGPESGLDDLLARLIGAGIAVRELVPVTSPLEAAFLALTDADDADPAEQVPAR